MNTKLIGGASALRNNTQNESGSNSTCNCSVKTAPPGTEVGILVGSDSNINGTTAIINIFQWYDNRPHPADVFKVPVTNKRNVNFSWQAKGANGSDHEKGAFYFAVTYARAGKNEKAFESLEKSYALREPYLINLKSDFAFDEMRADARFTDLLRRVGLEK